MIKEILQGCEVIFCVDQKKNQEGKGGIYLEIDIYFLCGGEGKGVKYLEKENMFLWWRRRIEKEKKENI